MVNINKLFDGSKLEQQKQEPSSNRGKLFPFLEISIP